MIFGYEKMTRFQELNMDLLKRVMLVQTDRKIFQTNYFEDFCCLQNQMLGERKSLLYITASIFALQKSCNYYSLI